MDTINFNYDLPERLIAQNPAEKRDGSKLLVYNSNADKQIKDCIFSDIINILPEGSLLVLNDTKVFPCNLSVKDLNSQKELQVFLTRIPVKGASGSTAEVLMISAKKLLAKGPVQIELLGSPQIKCQLYLDEKTNTPWIWFDANPEELLYLFDTFGKTPLPPYVKRPKKDEPLEQKVKDRLRYQTIYAQNIGAVAAPTAGFHFTEDIFSKLKEKNITWTSVTLHVGLGTFVAVKADKPKDHHMHQESCYIPSETYNQILDAQKQDRKIFCVGTTALRALEGLRKKASSEKKLMAECLDQWFETDIFIYPETPSSRFKPWCLNGIITNFHQPQSTLLMLMGSLIGIDEVHRIYQHAIAKEYRFFSYGDSSFIQL